MTPSREPQQATQSGLADTAESQSGGERADVRAVRERHMLGRDAARPETVAKRHEQGRRTTRENLHELLDEGTFVEYRPLVFAAQERRRPREELIERTPADGLVAGVGDVAGMRGHAKKD
ncbi:MAG: carboxyl transferase domain-containing protein, partial [Solirubrobacteraceae bacterium]